MCLLIGAGTLLAGCRDKPPLPSQFADLGDGNRVLLPVAAPWHAMAYKPSDTAAWVAFRKPDFDHPEVADSTRGGKPDSSRIKREIQAFIEEYNEVAGEQDFEELLLYHIESQQAALKPMLEGAKAVLASLKTLQDALTEKLADKQGEIEAAFATMRKGSSGTLVVSNLEVIGPAKVTGTMPPPFSRCTFLLVDDEWVLEVGDLPDPASMKPQMDMAMTMLGTLTQGLESGAMPAEVVLTQFQMMTKMAQAGQGGSDESGQDESDDIDLETEDGSADPD